MDNISINREHKDRLFRLLFGDERNKANLLSLYNAINHTDYTNVDEMEIMTMQDCIYMRMKNDISVLLCQVLALYEQQSSWNPNMPLRGLIYFAHLYEKYIKMNKLNIYGSKLLKLPTPQYIVFYNGMDMKPDEVTLRLSDAFENQAETGAFEWTAAVETTIQECIADNILTDFLIAHRAEVVDVCLTEYDEEFVMDALKKDMFEEGMEQGMAQKLVASVDNVVKNLGLSLEEGCVATGTTLDEYKAALRLINEMGELQLTV